MKPKDGRRINNTSPRGGNFEEKQAYADSFFGLARKPLEEERLRIIGLIVQTESIPTTKITPEDKEEILNRLWDTRRKLEAKLRLAL